ncbi:MAG: DUF268 domain-containing protein [Pseudomonadaceae bacterium]|nr:DUF268 domain-containing protein [Pseudomonadaceae bacterium]
MMSFLRRAHAFCSMHGINPLTMARSLRYLPTFVSDIARYRRSPAEAGFPLRLGNLFPVLVDLHDSAGSAASQSFIQDLWMARRLIPHLATTKGHNHLDIGSRIDGFVGSLLASGIQVTQVDIRPLPNPPQGLTFLQDDATRLASLKDGSVPSLSSLHAAEHFGLGRYGDPIDPSACFTFMHNLARVLKKGGRLYFCTPIGHERLEFNAHRIFNPARLLSLFAGAGLKVVETAVITSQGQLLEGANPADHAHEDFANGLFIFTK